MRRLISQLARFGAVGAVGFVIDVGLFNLLRSTVFEPSHVDGGAIWAKVVSTTVAIVANWIGNRYWTFRKEARKHPLSEAIEFFVVSIVGLGIQVGSLWISHYALGLTSQLDDNISANIVGLGVATIFRFALYRLWVFNPARKAVAAKPTSERVTPELGAPEAPVQPTG